MPLVHRAREFSLLPTRFVRPTPIDEEAAAATKMPFQDLGHALLAELGRVGWEVPNLEVATSTYGRGRNLLTAVNSISGRRPEGAFALHFRGAQELVGGYYRMTGLNSAILPSGLAVAFNDDGSRSLKRFTQGGDWSAVGEHGDGWATLGTAGPAAWSKAVAEVRTLVAGLMTDLAALPDASDGDRIDGHGFDPNLRRLISPEPIPVPAGFPVLYAWERIDELGRAALKRHHPERAEDDYVLAGNGLRLVSIGMGGGGLPLKATEGFSYASADPNGRPVAPGWTPREDVLPVEVKLAALNEIYVVDAAAYEETRRVQAAVAETEGRSEFTGPEIVESHRSVARTMVPAADYAGGFAEPLYLIGRQLHEDEARPMSGPVRVVVADGRVSGSMRDTETGLDLVVTEPEEANRRAIRDALRTAHRLAEVHGVRVAEIGLPAAPEAVPAF